MNRNYFVQLCMVLAAIVVFAQGLLATNKLRVYIPLIAQPPGLNPTLPTATAMATVTATTTATGSATTTATASATTTATATPTASATATTTATSTTQPQACVPVMPISISYGTLDNSGENFIDPQTPGDFGVIEEPGEFFGKTYRRLYFNSFELHFVRWRETQTLSGLPAASSAALAESLSGDGNALAGFQEVPVWPGDFPPLEYPLRPGEINAGDWLFGTGASYGTQPISDALRVLSATERLLILPVYTDVIGIGDDAKLFLTEFKVFLITNFGYLPERGNYMTLLAVGNLINVGLPTCGMAPGYSSAHILPEPTNAIHSKELQP
jgi:hypothetical protein